MSRSVAKDMTTKQGGEMNLKHIKCSVKCHLSKLCPKSKKKPSHRVGVEESVNDTPEQLVKAEKGNSTY